MCKVFCITMHGERQVATGMKETARTSYAPPKPHGDNNMGVAVFPNHPGVSLPIDASFQMRYGTMW